MMKFSVVIPTRNRASMLGYAINSVIHQDYHKDDYEIIVSNNNSSDDTENVIKSFKSCKLKYFKTNETLSMVDHFEYVLQKISGQWIFFLPDDDAMMPYSLSYMNKLISKYKDINVFRYNDGAIYVYSDGIHKDRNCITYKKQKKYSEIKINSKQKLHDVFKVISGEMPRIINSIVNINIINSIKKNYGRIFFPWVPDYTSGILFLANTYQYIHIERPLILRGKNLRSYGFGAKVNPNTLKEMFSEFKDFEGKFIYSPFPELFTLSNFLFDTLYRMKEILGKGFEDLEINPIIFREKLLREIDVYVEHGYPEYNNFKQYIMQYNTHSFNEKLWYMIIKSYQTIKNLQYRSKLQTLYGDKADIPFNDIFQAAQTLALINKNSMELPL